MSELTPSDAAPPSDKKLLWIAGVVLLIPIIALLLVPTYTKAKPEFWGFPFFVWYQFMWVLICAAFTTTANVLVKKARARGAEQAGLSGATRVSSPDRDGDA